MARLARIVSEYAYEDGSGGADLDANYVRPDYVTYPGPSSRRVVYYNYASSGVGAALGRLDNIASAGSPSASQKYASCMYLDQLGSWTNWGQPLKYKIRVAGQVFVA